MKPSKSSLAKTSVRLLASFCAVLAAQTHDSAWFKTEAAKDVQERHFQEAYKTLQVGTKQYPRNAELWNLLGIADAELGQSKNAESAFQKGLGVAPESVSLNENIGLLHYRNSDYAGTKKYLMRAVELGSKQAGVLFSLAGAQLRSGEQEKALANLRTLEPSLSGLTAYWEERGRAELLTNAVAAEMDFQQALRLEPNDLSALNGAATAAERQGVDEKALSYLIKARTVDPNNEETLVHFGAVCIRKDLGPDAIEVLEKARQLDPGNGAALFLLARAHISVQDWPQAGKLFEEYARRVPNDASAFYALGWVEIQLGRTDDAVRQLEHCLVLKPGLADARYELARLYFEGGEFEKAEKMLQIVLKQDPGHSKAQVAMGDILLRRGDLDGAQAYFERAVRLDATLASAHYKLATVLFRKHEEQKAASERMLAANLEAESKRASKTQLKLVLPEADMR